MSYSNLTFLQKIAMLFRGAVNKTFTKIFDEIKDQEHLIHNAAEITYNIYNYVENPNTTMGVIESVVNTVDPLLLPVVTQNLKLIAMNFKAFDDDVQSATDANDLAKRMAATFKELDADAFTFVSHNITSMLAKVFTPTTALGKIYAVVESIWQGFTKPEVMQAAA